MKKCKFCDIEAEDNTKIYNNCGSKEFNNKCTNCGTIFDSSFCPTCGKKAGSKPEICSNCGYESYDLFCPKCGNNFRENNENINIKTINKKSKVIVFIVLLIGLIGFIAIISNAIHTFVKSDINNQTIDNEMTLEDASNEPINDTIENMSEPTLEPTTAVKTKPAMEPITEPYNAKLTPGNYVVGMDIPSGKYSFTAMSGSGNVITLNDFEINVIMGSEDNGISIKTFTNATMKEGITLTVHGNLVLNITSKNANISEMKKRMNKLTKTFNLTSGNYIAGKDFPAGYYDIICIKGYGNVFSSNLNDSINLIMSKEGINFSSNKYKNAILDEGTELSLRGVTSKLVPSK